MYHGTIPALPDLTGKITRLDNGYSTAGGFGDVHKHQYQDNEGIKDVAVKVFRFPFMLGEDEGDKQHNKMIRRELGLCKRLHHPNIVPFLGIVYGFGIKGNASLVSLWMPNGTLQDYLTTHCDLLTVTRRLELLSDIAEGLNYLHSFPIMHGDLKDNNILLDTSNHARITDFGNSSLIRAIPQAADYYLQATFARPGAVRWTAPELCTEEEEMPPPTTKMDIYSFGNLALLVMSGTLPWSEIRNDIAIVLKLSRGETPTRPQLPPISDPHWDLIRGCWSKISERPSAEDIVSSIQELHQRLGSPPFRKSAPNIFTGHVDSNPKKKIRILNDGIRQLTGKFANFSDAPTEVGDYGILGADGEFVKQGNIYDYDFRKLLEKSGLDIMKSMPENGAPEDNYLVASSGTRIVGLDINQGSGLESASFKFLAGKRSFLLFLSRVSMTFLPRQIVNDTLLKHLEGKVLVASTMKCSDYLVCMSGKSGGTVCLDQIGWTQPSVSGNVGHGGWTSIGDVLIRKVHSDDISFTPLFSVQRRVAMMKRLFR